jgi:hypothetical protein
VGHSLKISADLAPLDPAKASKTIQSVNAMNLAKTPIADSLARVESDLKKAPGRKMVVLVTDGEEACGGKHQEVIQKLQDKGFDVILNIVGFAIDDDTLEAQFESWADLGEGRYFSAKSQEGLSESLKEALRTSFAVYDAASTLVVEGMVGGEPLQLEQGYDRVVIRSSPPLSFPRAEVPGEKAVMLHTGSR